MGSTSRATMRVAPDDPKKTCGLEGHFVFQILRQAGEPFTSSVFTTRKTRWVTRYSKCVNNDQGCVGLSFHRYAVDVVGHVFCCNRPGNPGDFIRESTGHNIRVASQQQAIDPFRHATAALVQMQHPGAGALHE